MGSVLAINPAVNWAASGEDAWAVVVSQVASGNDRALAELYDGTNGMVYGIALRILRDPSSAEDVALEVYLQVWRTAHSYDASRGTVSTWLVTLTRSRAIDWLRSRKARRADLEQDVDDIVDLRDHRPSPEHSSIDAGRARIVRQAMTELPADQREALELAYFSGLSHSEIAAQKGLPLGTVKTRIRLAMLRLRDLLGPYAEGL